MIASYVEPSLVEALRGHLPERAQVHTRWLPFVVSLREADVALVAIRQPGVSVTEEDIQAVADRGYPPLVLVTDPRGSSLQLLARVRCHGCVGLDEMVQRLHDALSSALLEDPRSQAARAILSETKPGAVTARVVRSVLEDPVPPRSIAELSNRLRCSLRTIENHWRQDLGARTGVPLILFIRRGRGLWAASALDDKRPGGLARVAADLGVDASTTYRDLCAAGLYTRDVRRAARRKAVRGLLADLGVGDGRTWRRRDRG